jgi:molybdopterin converting factor small subunit
VETDGATIGEVFRSLTERYPGMKGQLLGDDGGIRKFVNVYKNDEDVRYLQALDTPVSEGDVISILPAVAGGA